MADEETDIEGSDLAAIIQSEISAARRYTDNDLTDKRTLNAEYYDGIMTDAPAAANRSSVMSRDVTDTMSWMLPGIIRVYTASDNMALYEPSTERDREFAQQASDYINYLFFKENDGYRTLYNGTHDSLLVGNGVVRHYWDPTPVTEISTHTRLTLMGLMQLTEDEGVEILTQEQNDEPDMVEMPGPQTGEMVSTPQPTFNVKVQRTTSRGKLCIHTGKPENFFLDSQAVTIEQARFAAYLHDDKTRSDLVEMGFDRDMVEDLSSDALSFDSKYGRASVRDRMHVRTDMLKSTQLIDLYECYVKADVDGDGVAETVQAWYAGDAGAGKVLAWEVWEDDLPFSDIPCYPVPHRWDSDSVADRTRDVQKIKTVLLRQGLDNLYASNLPMQEVEAGSVLNPDILVAPKFGGIIWKKPGSGAVTPQVIPYVADKVFGALEYMDQIIAKRTGVSRTTMALDPEALQNQTATANQNQRDAGYSQIELVARNQAELGWTRVFKQLLKLIVKHQDRPRTIRLRDKFVEMDPRSWNAGMDVTVNVGLGTGSRDRDMVQLQGVLQNQLGLADRFMQSGAINDAIDMLPRIILTMTKIAESAGLKNPDAYYPEYAEDQVKKLKQAAAAQAQAPDPALALEEAKGQVQMQIEQGKAETTMQVEAGKNELAKEQAVIDSEAAVRRERAQLEADMLTKQKDRENTLILEQQKQTIEREKIASAERIKLAELALKRAELAQTRELEIMKMSLVEVEESSGGEAGEEGGKSPALTLRRSRPRPTV